MHTMPLHVILDLITAVAYFSIPIALFVFVRKRKDLDFKWIFVCFILFILLCGATHIMHFLEFIYPTAFVHSVDIIIRGLAATISIITAITLWKIIPKALKIPSPSELEKSNIALNERTEQLHKANQLLKLEIKKHEKTTEELLYLTSIMKASDDAIIGVTLDEKISSWNLGATEIFKYLDVDIINRSFYTLVHPDNKAEMEQIFTRIKIGQRLANHELKQLTSDGDVLIGSITLSPVRKDHTNEVVGISVIIRDVTELKKLHEEMNRLSQLHIVGELAASVAHEIRNPMTVIRGFVQMYSKEIENCNEAHGKIIMEELDRTQAIIDSYLSLAKPQKEKVEDISIEEAMLQMIEVMKSYANYQQVEIISHIESNLFVKANKEKFSQMFVNVIKNGIESMPNGGTLTITAYKTDDGINIDISDTGVGMTREEIKRLGSPFYSTKEKGTGLGTMVMYKILQTFNWKLNVSSEKGKGSCFSFLIR